MMVMPSSSSALASVSCTASAVFPPRAPYPLRRIRISGVANDERALHARGTRSDGSKQLSLKTIRRNDIDLSSQLQQKQKETEHSVVWEPSKVQVNKEEAVQRPSSDVLSEPSNAPPAACEHKVPLHPFDDVKVGTRWREIQGSKQWEGLLDPVDPVLRSELIRFGEFAQAGYDAFDNETNSKYCGSCRFSRQLLLEKVKLENRGYDVTHYIHSTTSERLMKTYHRKPVRDEENWSQDSTWMGFVAVAVSPREIARLGRRDIVVVWRGTVTDGEWMEHFQNVFIPRGLDLPGQEHGDHNRGMHLRSKQIKVEDTFLDMYQSKDPNSRRNKNSAQDQATAAVKELLESYKHEEDVSITITGHSMGGALATLFAYDLARSGINRRSHDSDPFTNLNSHHINEDEVPITVYSFASPRVGNNAFRDRLTDLGVKVLRVVNVNDFVPYTPGVIFNEKLEFLHPRNFWRSKNKLLKLLNGFLDLLPTTYAHVGVELELDDLHSPYLRNGPLDRMNVHDLEVYLHLLDGFVAKGAPFTASGRRDIALVNKRTNFLHCRHRIPEFWWQEKDKGLVKDVNGRWILPEREQ